MLHPSHYNCERTSRHMNPDTSFWNEMANLTAANSIVIDRPKGSPHPCYPKVIYPLDYGYLKARGRQMGMVRMYGLVR